MSEKPVVRPRRGQKKAEEGAEKPRKRRAPRTSNSKEKIENRPTRARNPFVSKSFISISKLRI